MILELLASQTALRDLYDGSVPVLTASPGFASPRSCYVLIKLGDGVNDADGSGGEFEVTVDVGGYVCNGGPQPQLLGPEPKPRLEAFEFTVDAGEDVTVYLKSPNAADTNVMTFAGLYLVDTPTAAQINTAIEGGQVGTDAAAAKSAAETARDKATGPRIF